MQDPGCTGVLPRRSTRMADDNQAPVQVVMDGQEQEIFLKDVQPLAHTVTLDQPAHACVSLQMA